MSFWLSAVIPMELTMPERLAAHKLSADNTNDSNYPKFTRPQKLPIFTVDMSCCRSYDLLKYSRTYEFEVVLLRNVAA